MNKLFRLNEKKQPVFFVTAVGDPEFCNYLWKIQKNKQRQGVVRVCRGRKMTSIGKIFDEISAAFQFPYYFGENWAALEECLSDLSWLEGDFYLLCITSLQDLLAEEEEVVLRDFLMLLTSVAEGWAGGNPNLELFGRVPTLFRVLVQVPPGGEGAAQQKLRKFGIDSELQKIEE